MAGHSCPCASCDLVLTALSARRGRWLWEDEPNGYASLVPREDRGGRDYENSHWQCIVAAEWPGVGA